MSDASDPETITRPGRALIVGRRWGLDGSLDAASMVYVVLIAAWAFFGSSGVQLGGVVLVPCLLYAKRYARQRAAVLIGAAVGPWLIVTVGVAALGSVGLLGGLILMPFGMTACAMVDRTSARAGRQA